MGNLTNSWDGVFARSFDCDFPVAQLITMSSTVVASNNQISCDLLDEAVILDLKTGVYYGLDPVGARIWSLVQEPKQMQQILGVLLAEYEVERDRCEIDLLALMRTLRERSLIEVMNDARG